MEDIDQGLCGFSTEVIGKAGLILARDDCFDLSDDL
jgi:hypothetical protein